MVIEAKGKLIFNPVNITKKHEKQDWKKIVMINIDCNIDKYYAWFLKKRFDLNLLPNLRGPHITIISDIISNIELYNNAENLFNNKEISFFYELEPRTNAKHWWLRIHCPEAESIREYIGLTREPYHSFHLTIGYVNEKNLKHSEYIYSTIKYFEILSSEPRKKLAEHQIIKFY